MSTIAVYSGRASRNLARAIGNGFGVELGNIAFRRFSDGETKYDVHGDIAGKHVIVVQSMNHPVERNFFDLFGVLSGIENRMEDRIRADDTTDPGEEPASVTVVIPFIGYRRQERARNRGEAVMARTMARMVLTFPFINHVVLVDPHSEKLTEFFGGSPFVKAVDTVLIKAKAIRALMQHHGWEAGNMRVVAPDKSRHEQTERLASTLGIQLVRYLKDRPSTNVTQVTGREDADSDISVENCICVVNDDEIDTGSTSMGTGRDLVRGGARGLVMVSTHGVFSGNAVPDMDDEPAVVAALVSDTVYQGPEKECGKITPHTYSVATEIVCVIRA